MDFCLKIRLCKGQERVGFTKAGHITPIRFLQVRPVGIGGQTGGFYMAAFFHSLRQYMNGVRTFEKQRPYQLLGLMLALVHFVFASIFFSVYILPLAIYNSCVIVFYIVETELLLRLKNPTLLFVFALCEILFHSVLATLLCGWDWGFMLYTIGLVSLTFYMCFTLDRVKNELKLSLALSFAIYMIYFFTLAISRHTNPVYEEIDEHVKVSTYYFNTFLSFFFILFVSVLFSMEVRYMKRNLEKENATLTEDANSDPLTGLNNRRSMNGILKEKLKEAQTSGEPFSLLMIDIDSFKAVNDTYGHQMGDEVLVGLAKILKEQVRESDVVCRWGGEEMLILIHNKSEAAEACAERIRLATANHLFKGKNIAIRITITIGLATYQEGLSLRELIECADRRLYYGKEHGKNQVVGAS